MTVIALPVLHNDGKHFWTHLLLICGDGCEPVQQDWKGINRVRSKYMSWKAANTRAVQKKSDSPEACVHRNRQVKCSSSFLFICRAGRRRSAWLKCVETWSLAKSVRLIVKSCHIGSELMKWLYIAAEKGESGCRCCNVTVFLLLPSDCNKAWWPALPFTALISCCQGGSHVVHLLNTLHSELDPGPAACNQRLLSTQELLIKFM